MTTTSDASGAWSATITDQTFPCLVTVSGGSVPAGQALYSLALDATHLNVTPLTGLVLASALDAAPSAINASSLSSSVSTALAQGLAKVNAILTASGYRPTNGNPLTAPFQASAGDEHDDLISTLMRSLADENIGYDALLTSIATAGNGSVPIPLTHVYKAAELTQAAMPQLNNASLAVSNGELSMVLGGSGAASNVGAYVGPGTGNKAILQLPGLNGVKLSTFKDMTLDVKGESNYYNGSGLPNLYTYVNFVVDLQCTGQPLAAGTTIDQVRAQRRIVIFDPFYKFIQRDNSISATDFFSAKFDFGTGGWRASAGTSLGSGVFVPNLQPQGYNGSETLQTFDFQTYPNACIVDGISADGGLYRDTTDPQCVTSGGLTGNMPASCGKTHSGALVVLGGSTILTVSEWKVKKVRFNGTNVRNFVFQ
ncbi:hypothetical protein QTI24_30465 [Variovorax sp. J22P240]|uniref:hypothetical protein n=1 Tax=Variovorax sp. J22P240 TaxID=3053514 RepID=UPI00257885EB|nr:hypothetical protein [Variovorax sp. J22P240]MDM0002946.1 hypothetical protein [Variovorax sp. J22P240]